MEIAKIDVSRADARKVYCQTLTAGMAGVEVTFSFDDAWDGLHRIATFKAGGTAKDVLLTDDRCEIPPEVLAKPCARLVVGVYGERADGTLVIPTLWAELGRVEQGVTPSGDISGKHTPEVWAQILDMIGNLEELDSENKETLVAAINEALRGGADREEIKQIVDEYLKEHGTGGTVKTVNGIAPDENGNVQIPVSGQNLTLDTTLTQSGKAADAKAVGDALNELEEKIPSIEGLAKEEDIPTKPEDIGAQPKGNYLTSAPVTAVNGKTGAVQLSAEDVGARPNTWTPTAQEVRALPDTYTPPDQTAEQVGADPAGTAASTVTAHNTSGDAHTDLRLEIQAIREQLTAFLDVDEETLNELSELIARIVANQTSIEQLTTGKVSVSDIINNLTTNVANKPLSAAQGVAIKALIDGLSSGKLDASKLTEAINTALAQAKANGEFDGADGDPGRGIKSIARTSGNGAAGTTDTYTITYTDSTTSTFTVRNGSNGAAGTAATLEITEVTALAYGAAPTVTEQSGSAAQARKYILGIPAGKPGADGADAETVPDYVIAEAEAVARSINQHQSGDSIVIPVLTDAHCGYYTDKTNAATKLAGQLLYQIGKRAPFDCIANCGDAANGAWDTTRDMTYEQYEDYTELTAEAHRGVPAVWVSGNHDDAPYMATADRATQTDMFALIGRKNRLSGSVCPNGCCYGYLDLENRKLRVIYLDTDDKRTWGTVRVTNTNGLTCDYLNAHNIGGVQLQWLADKALNFDDKENPTEWSIVIISHVALNISGTFTDAVSGTVYANNTENAAAILNAYRTCKSGSITHNGVTVNYDFSAIENQAVIICAVHGHNHKFSSEELTGGILSIGCPNVMNGRERASDDGNTYTKTAGTANGTSFCILTIDRENCVIYADCVGAGYDREFEYTTEVVSYTNQLPISTDASGNVYNGKGYKENTYISSGNDGAKNGVFTSGFIPAVVGDTLYFENVGMQSGQDGHRVAFYNASKGYINLTKTNNSGYTGFTWGDDGNIKAFHVMSGSTTAGTAFIRFCCSYIGDDSIVTVNEPIE